MPGIALSFLEFIMKAILGVFALAVFSGSALAQAQPKQPVKLTTEKVETFDIVYKKTTQGDLTLHGYRPTGWKATDKRPVIVFFFGGGWKNGVYTQFVPQAEYFASRGIVAISADYRIESKHKTTPDVAVEDAKSAIRYVRDKATELGIDPNKIIASGGSAGGHLAACTALVEGFNCADDAKGVSSVPNALVLYNPALNLSSGTRTFTNARGEDIGKAISPTLYLSKNTPPAVVFFGTSDKLAEQGYEYAKKAKDLGVRAEVYTAEDQPHGFFNRSPWIEPTTVEADRFLKSLGYLEGEPTLKAGEKKLVRYEQKK